MARQLRSNPNGLLRGSLSCLVLATLLVGCSSLPDEPRPATDLNSRTAGLHKLGARQFQAGRLDKAQAHFDQALAIHARVDDQAGVALCFLSLGRVELAREDLDAAADDFREARLSLKGMGRPDLQAQCLAGLAAVDMARGEPAMARQQLEQALKLPLADDSRERAVLHHDLGSAFLQEGQPAEARKHLERALDLHRRNADRPGLATTYYSLALATLAEGDAAAAVPHALQALILDRGSANTRGVRQDLRLLEKLHRQLGHEELAEDYRRRGDLAEW